LFRFPNNPPVVEVVVVPNSGLDVVVCPKRPPPVCGCEVVGVVVAAVVEGVLVVVVVRPPNKGFCVVCPPKRPPVVLGGGPAGVVDVPKRPPPEEVGVELPNNPPPVFEASPKRPVVFVCPAAVLSLVLGV